MPFAGSCRLMRMDRLVSLGVFNITVELQVLRSSRGCITMAE